jgi:hypothetical protein
VQSIQVIKTLVTNGNAASVLPCGSVQTELLDGRLTGRRVGAPGLRWTLYFSSAARRTTPLSEDKLVRLVEHSVDYLLQKLGPLATPLWNPRQRLAA